MLTLCDPLLRSPAPKPIYVINCFYCPITIAVTCIIHIFAFLHAVLPLWGAHTLVVLYFPCLSPAGNIHTLSVLFSNSLLNCAITLEIMIQPQIAWNLKYTI